MKFTNKMMLVPEQALNQIKHSDELEKNGIDNQVVEFRKALHSVLNNVKLSPEEQMLVYSQLFSRYLHLYNDSKQPATVIFQPETSNFQQNGPTENENIEYSNTKVNIKEEPKQGNEEWIKRIFHHLPKIHKKKAELMIDFLKTSSNIAVGEKGEIIIDNQKIPNSHIVDLVHDVLRDRPTSDPPIGIESFVRALKQSNIPVSYIGNPARVKMIKKSDVEASEFQSPITSVRKRLAFENDDNVSKRKKKVAYDSW